MHGQSKERNRQNTGQTRGRRKAFTNRYNDENTCIEEFMVLLGYCDIISE